MAADRTERIASVDYAWLRMEDPTNLMMITGVFLFDQPLNIDRLRRLIEQRLLTYARFRQRVVLQGPNAPYWEADPYFDLRNHLRHVALPAPGDQAALQDLVSDFMSTPLDLARPLWQWHVVEGFQGNGCALVCRVHHAIADGIALVQVLLSMTEEDPDAPTPQQEPKKARRTPSLLEEMITPTVSAINQAIRVTEQAATKGLELLSNPMAALDINRLGMVSSALAKLTLMSPDPKTVFKGPLRVTKRAAWSDHIPLEQVKAVGAAFGGTINDVLMTAVAGALRRYMIHRHATVDGIDIRAAIPVNLRTSKDTSKLGNQFGLVFLAMPIGVADPVERLIVVKQRMSEIKNSAEAVVAFGILNVLGSVPEALQDMGVGLFGSKATMVLTNVPGPRQRLYFVGAPIQDLIFWVPQSGRLGLGISIFSYAGSVMVGFAADTGLIPDPDVLAIEFQAEFAAMVASIQPPEPPIVEPTEVVSAYQSSEPEQPPTHKPPSRKRGAKADLHAVESLPPTDHKHEPETDSQPVTSV
jgi:WS/DGAT/MGAT family acyltransferase